MTNMFELNARLLDAMRKVDQCITELEQQVRAKANAEKVYRRAKSLAYLQVTGKNVQEREAKAETEVQFAEGTLGDLRYARDLADGLCGSAQQALKAHTQIISALQTMASGYREEMRFAGGAPTERPGDTVNI